jgi:DNA-binding transcriptional MerR regulator
MRHLSVAHFGVTFIGMADEEPMYGPDELAERAGVSRRTVRYYVQRGLLPAPAGLGRGKHYSQAHLDKLLQIRELQGAGVPLEEVGARLDGRMPAPPVAQAPAQTAYTRVTLAEGVELHVRGLRLSAAQLHQLIAQAQDIIGEE